MLRLFSVPGLALAAFGLSCAFVAAQEVQLAPDLPRLDLVINGQPVTIARQQDLTATLSGEAARTVRPCPGECLQPMQPVPGVGAFGELEVIGFLAARVAAGRGVVIDARLPQGFAAGALPGAVNVPFATLAPDNPYRTEILKALGVTIAADGTADFSAALDLVVYCDGPWSDKAPQALRNLAEAGYPPAKLNYYRGGVQEWQHSGLDLAVAGQAG